MAADLPSMPPASEVREWVEIFSKQPILSVLLAWGIIEVRRFLKVLHEHMTAEETILKEIRDGLIRELATHMRGEESTLSEIRDRLRPRRPPPAP